MSTVKSQFYKKFYFPDSSTACRTKLIAGTCFGSLARKRICGVLGSVSGKPSISCMLPATHENGSQSGPTSSTSSPLQTCCADSEQRFRLHRSFPRLRRSASRADTGSFRCTAPAARRKSRGIMPVRDMLNLVAPDPVSLPPASTSSRTWRYAP